MAQTARRYIEIEVSADKALRVLKGIESSSRKSEKQLGALKKQVSALGTTFRGLAGFVGARELFSFADAARDVQARLGAVTDTTREAEVAFEDLLALGNKVGVEVNNLASSYTKLAVAVPTAQHNELRLALDTISTTLATTGASVQQVNAVLLQMSQALGSGALQGDEFRSVFENAPVLLRAWREALGATDVSFRDLSSSAALSTESFFELLPQIKQLTVEMVGLEKPPLTIARAFVQLQNEFVSFLGDAQKSVPVFEALAKVIQLVAENLELLLNLAVAGGLLKLAGYLTGIGTRLQAVGVGILAAASGNAKLLEGTAKWKDYSAAIGAAATGVGGMATGFGLLRTALNSVIGRFLVFLGVVESISYAWENLRKEWERTDEFIVAIQGANEQLKDMVSYILEIRTLDLSRLTFGDLKEQSKGINAELKRTSDRIKATKQELEDYGVIPGLDITPGKRAFLQLFDPKAIDEIEALNQQLLNQEKLAENLRKEFAKVDVELKNYDHEAARLIPTLTQVQARAEQLSDTFGEIARRDQQIQFEIELLGLNDVETAAAEVRQEFQSIENDLEINIRNINRELNAMRDAANMRRSADELKAFEKRIGELEVELIKATSAMSTFNEVREEQESRQEGQTRTLATLTDLYKQIDDAVRAATKGTDLFADVQFNLQDAFEEGTISAQQLTQALDHMERVMVDVKREASGIEQILLEISRNADAAQGRLNALQVGGPAGLEEFSKQQRLREDIIRSRDDLLREMGTTLQEATPDQIQIIIDASQAIAETHRLSESASGLTDQYQDLQGVLGDHQTLDSYLDAVQRAVSLSDKQRAGLARVLPIIEEMGQQYGVNRNLIIAMMKQESNFVQNATSPAGAMGLMQLMPATARAIGKEVGVEWANGFYDAQDNIEVGVAYIKKILLQNAGDAERALRGYNAGPGRIDQSRQFSETNDYVAKIIPDYERLRAIGGDVTTMWQEQATAEEAAVQQKQALQSSFLSLVGAMDPLTAAVLEYKENLELMEQAEAAGIITTEQLAFAKGLLEQQLNETVKSLEKDTEKTNSLSDAIANDLGNSIKGVITGTSSWQDALSSLESQLISTITQILVIEPLIQSLKTAMSGVGGSGTGGLFSGLFSGAFGGARAIGGPVTANSSYLVGESGPELFVPSTAGTVVSNRDMAERTVVTVNAPINISPRSDAQQVRDSATQVAASMGREVQRAMRRNN